MTNDQMKEGRFLKLHRGRKVVARMNACWDVGGFVRIGTARTYCDVKPRSRALITMGADGSLYMARGKYRDCIDFCSIQFSA